MSASRRRAPEALLIAVVLLLLGPWGDGDDARANTPLRSRPPGIHVELEGPVSVSGTTPFPLDALPPGSYRLRTGGIGMPTAGSEKM